MYEILSGKFQSEFVQEAHFEREISYKHYSVLWWHHANKNEVNSLIKGLDKTKVEGSDEVFEMDMKYYDDAREA